MQRKGSSDQKVEATTVYLLAFDRHRVEQALGEGYGGDEQEAGRNYLEKIVEVSFDLPLIRPDDLIQLLLRELPAIVSKGPIGEFRKRDWDNFFGLGMRPYPPCGTVSATEHGTWEPNGEGSGGS